MIPEHTGALSNFWWAVAANDYSMSIVLIATFIIAVLNALAIIHPEAKSILCLFKGWIYGFPGMKKEITTTASQSSSSTTTTTQSTNEPELFNLDTKGECVCVYLRLHLV